MTDTKDGGPAFPRPLSTDDHREPCNVEFAQSGMSLRDFFAAHALTGMLADKTPAKYYDEIAGHAYRFADAMLAARAPKDKQP